MTPGIIFPPSLPSPDLIRGLSRASTTFSQASSEHDAIAPGITFGATSLAVTSDKWFKKMANRPWGVSWPFCRKLAGAGPTAPDWQLTT
jgi:hypothetical protein